MGASVDVGLGEWIAALEYMDRMVDRASKYALRQGGREVIKAARREVPVFTGDLRRSISNAKRIKEPKSHDFTLGVGPHGSPSYLYAGKIEESHPYMSPAISMIEGRLGEIYLAAEAKTLAKFG